MDVADLLLLLLLHLLIAVPLLGGSVFGYFVEKTVTR